MITAHSKKALMGLAFIAFFAAFSCNAPERAAEVVTKKAKEQVRKMAMGKQISVEECLDQIQEIAIEPSFSDHITEKTELISTW